jgi:hypothetical protein
MINVILSIIQSLFALLYVCATNQPTMKFTFTHHHHSPSKSILDMIEAKMHSLLPDLKIDEARVSLDRSLTESPPYSASFHLVTPGPDVIVSSSDHTLRAAVLKAFKLIDEKIEQRQTKRAKRREAAPAIELTRRRPSGSPRR